MALVSMTGFGRGQAAAGGVQVEVELSAVNRKQLDVRVSLPRSLGALEARVQDSICQRVARGSVTGGVKVNVGGAARRHCAAVDVEAAAAFVARLREVAAALGLRDDLGAHTLVLLPEVVQVSSLPDDTEALWGLLKRALEDALDELDAMRRREGTAIERDLARRFAQLQRMQRQVAQRAPKVVARHRQNLLKRIRAAGVPIAANDPVLLKEITFFADRSDISEELTRLKSHFSQVEGLLKGRKPAGRTLDFLCQELFREINTIGSKASDATIARVVVAFKALLETVREQVQNVE